MNLIKKHFKNIRLRTRKEKVETEKKRKSVFASKLDNKVRIYISISVN